MTKKIVKYKLKTDGTIPSFVEDGGYLPLEDWLIGLSVDNAILDNEAIFLETKEDVLNYVEEIKPIFINIILETGEEIVKTAQEITDSFWSKFNKDN